MPKLVNFVGFQVCWFACVLGAAHDIEWLGPLVVLAWCVAHLAGARERGREILSLALVGVTGLAVDAIELHAGWLVYSGTLLGGLLPPAWILALWITFATTYESSLAWVTRRPWLAAAFGLVGSPLSYWAGARLGAVRFGEPLWPSIAGIAVAWAIAMPLSARLRRAVLVRERR